MTIEKLKKAFINKGLTLGSVESFTGGLFAATITSKGGASKFYKGGLVTYATEEKIKLLGIDENEVKQFGVVSKEIAYAMARNGRKVLNVDVCISFTGNAGPEAMEGKPVGEVYIGIADKKSAEIYKLNLKGERDEIQDEAVQYALEKIFKKIS